MTYSLTVTEHGAAVLSSSPVLENCRIAVGDGENSLKDSLEHEVYRVSPALVKKETGRLTIEVSIPRNVGGFAIQEIAVLDVEDKVLAIGKFPYMEKPYLESGAAFELILNLEIVFSGAENVTITIEPSINYVTEARLQAALEEALGNFDPGSPNDLTLDDIQDGTTRSLTALENRLEGINDTVDDMIKDIGTLTARIDGMDTILKDTNVLLDDINGEVIEWVSPTNLHI